MTLQNEEKKVQAQDNKSKVKVESKIQRIDAFDTEWHKKLPETIYKIQK